MLDGGRFEIVELLGLGAFGAVYKAMHLRLGLSCAVKELRYSGRTLQEQAEVEAWFVREAEVLMGLHHPMIPRITDRFTEGGRQYLVMDLVDGHNLEQELATRGAPLAEDEVLDWGCALCDVLGYLHARQPSIIFRDLKPANIMRTSHGTLFLVDFGIARTLPAVGQGGGAGGTLQPGTVIGTPGYAPPEQYQGLAEPRSDIYALGATLHRLLTRYDIEHAPPFTFPPARQLRGDLGPQTEAVLARALSLKPDDRFPNVTSMAMALGQISGHRPINVGPTLMATTAHAVPTSAAATSMSSSQSASTPLIVSPDPNAGDYSTISEAVSKAQSGARIEVRPGKYEEIIVIDKHLEIVGTGRPEDVIIQSRLKKVPGKGSLSGSTTTISPSCIVMQCDKAVMRNVTIESLQEADDHEPAIKVLQGGLILEDCTISGCGVDIVIQGHTAAPIIRRCRLRGAGIRVTDHGGGLLDDCDICSNYWSPYVHVPAIEVSHGANPVFRNCRIHGGDSDKYERWIRIVFASRGQGTLEDCDIAGAGWSDRPAITVEDGASPIIRRCRIRDSWEGIVFTSHAQGTLEDCDIAGTGRETKPAITVENGANPVIRQCRLHHNRNGAVFTTYGQGTLEDCKIFANSGQGVEIRTGATPTIRRCQITDNRDAAIFVDSRGEGTVEHCDLTRNGGGSWSVEPNSRIRRLRNTTQSKSWHRVVQDVISRF